MDAFFVNVHLLDHPEDRGLPLVVGGRPEHRGVVASASYEARRYGIRSAMPAVTAVRLCPELKFVGHNWPRIKESSRQVMAILRQFGPVQPMSVDEAYVDLTPGLAPATTAARLRDRVKAETGLPASVGLATSKLVAKVASDYGKPNGFTIVRPRTEAAFLALLPVRVIWGIGPRTAERLARLGIKTCGELAAFDIQSLQDVFRKNALWLQERARGKDDRPVAAERGPAKSISQERTFNQDVADPVFLRDRLRRMAEGVAVALQRRDLVAHTVTVKFRYADFTTFTRQRSVSQGLQSADDIFRLAEAIWQEHWPPEQRLRLLGVGVSGLAEPEGFQLSLDLGAG